MEKLKSIKQEISDVELKIIALRDKNKNQKELDLEKQYKHELVCMRAKIDNLFE